MMDPVALTAWGLLGTFALIALHVPVGVAMGIAGVVGFGALAGFGPAFAMVASETANNLASLELATIPLFVLMGSFAALAGMSEDLYRLAYAVVGHRRGESDLQRGRAARLQPVGTPHDGVQVFEGSEAIDRPGPYAYGLRIRAGDSVLWA